MQHQEVILATPALGKPEPEMDWTKRRQKRMVEVEEEEAASSSSEMSEARPSVVPNTEYSEDANCRHDWIWL
jgi:hypothetical protein